MNPASLEGSGGSPAPASPSSGPLRFSGAPRASSADPGAATEGRREPDDSGFLRGALEDWPESAWSDPGRRAVPLLISLRPAELSGASLQAARLAGWDVAIFPQLKLTADPAALRRVARAAAQCDVVFFSSPFAASCAAASVASGGFVGRLAFVGEGTREAICRALAQAGLDPRRALDGALSPAKGEAADAESLLKLPYWEKTAQAAQAGQAAQPAQAGRAGGAPGAGRKPRALSIAGRQGKGAFARGARALGWECEEAAVYDSRRVMGDYGKMIRIARLRQTAAVLATSSAIARSWAEGASPLRALDLPCVAIHPRVLATLRAQGALRSILSSPGAEAVALALGQLR